MVFLVLDGRRRMADEAGSLHGLANGYSGYVIS